MVGSDYFTAGAHAVGIPTGGGAALASLDPDIAPLEQLKTDGTGWLPQSATGTVANTVYINPGAELPGIGTQERPFSSWYDVAWAPGTAYLQLGGSVSTTPLIVTGVGTAQSPILIGSYGGGAAMIASMVAFDNASHVALVGVTVAGSPLAGIMIANGSNYIEIAGDTVAYSTEGINIADGAGSDDLIVGNTIASNVYFGIGVTDISHGAADQSVIAGNLIIGNGSHGIELDGNWFTVENNLIYGNGMTMPGSSGIHVYATSATQGAGLHNTLRYNILMANRDSQAQDGNGIELDQWTADNQVIGNLTTANDGAGIELYDSSNNLVQDNTMIGDSLDEGHTHAERGETGMGSAFAVSLSTGNVFNDNTAISLSPNASAILIDTATPTASMTIGNNIFINYAGGPVFSWAGVVGTDLATWNSKPKGGVDSFTL